jgi:chaperone modulatory protein CbpM
MTTEPETLHGIVLDERVEFSLHQVCRICGTEEDMIIALVQEGVVEPLRPTDDMAFSAAALLRIRKAIRLQQDLGVNLAGAALALELIDDIARLEQALFGRSA